MNPQQASTIVTAAIIMVGELSFLVAAVIGASIWAWWT